MLSANFKERMWLKQKIIFRTDTIFCTFKSSFYLKSLSHTFSLSPPFLSWSMLTLSWTGQLIRSSRARRVWSDLIFLSQIKYLVFQKDLEYFSLLFNLQISKKWYKGFLTRASNTFYGSQWDQWDCIWKISLRRLLPLTGSSFTPAIP